MYAWEKDEALIRRYHLGDVSRREYGWVALCALLSSSYAEGVGVVEDELVDDFVLGALSGRELALFVGYFMRSPGGAFKVRFARALFAYVGARVPSAGRPVAGVRRGGRKGSRSGGRPRRRRRKRFRRRR